MNLDTTAEKEKMIDAYHAYLENTPGSKKALHELLTKKHLIGLKTESPPSPKPKVEEPKPKAEAPKSQPEEPKQKTPEKSNIIFL